MGLFSFVLLTSGGQNNKIREHYGKTPFVRFNRDLEFIHGVSSGDIAAYPHFGTGILGGLSTP